MNSGPIPFCKGAWIGSAFALAFGLVACSSDVESDSSETDAPKRGSMSDRRAAREPRPIDRERPEFCAREGEDAVREVFCATTRPTIRGLRDLQVALGVEPEELNKVAPNELDPHSIRGVAFFAVLGHSTSLSGHRVSPINPRVISLRGNTMMTFQRGVQQLEVVTLRRDVLWMNFYLFTFEQECNRSANGCSPGDLYTPKVENDWLAVRIQDDEDLKNTPSDCRQCHQRGRDYPSLLMRELKNPWTHFFEPPIDIPTKEPGVQGVDLMRDYLAAKGDEPYGGFAIDTVTAIASFMLEMVVGSSQPVLFDAPGIENERWPYTAGVGYASEPQPSPTWNAAYEAFKQGEQLALPYVEPRVSDVDKQAVLSDAYARYRAGELSEAELPDLTDIFPDDPQTRAQIGLATEPDASPADALIQACGSCHNDVLDQSISRARFNINLWKGDPDQIDRAIERIQRSPSDPGVMPPPDARQLTDDARERLLAYLKDDPLASDPDPRLVRAAELGMLGGAKVRVIDVPAVEEHHQ